MTPHKDPVKRREYLRRWKSANGERVRQLNKWSDAAIHANTRAERYGATGRLTAGDVRDCLSPGRCHYCGASERLCIDHVVPLSKGGANDPNNLVPACFSCNASKWTGSKPGRWATSHDACVMCLRTDARHAARGMCLRCYSKARRAS